MPRPQGISLVFPDGERSDQRYSVSMFKTVPLFKLDMGNLLRTHSPVSLHVSPDWIELDHQGTITDRFLPNSACSLLFTGHASPTRTFFRSFFLFLFPFLCVFDPMKQQQNYFDFNSFFHWSRSSFFFLVPF